MTWRWISTGKFLFILFLFLSPFTTLSCASTPIYTFTGTELALGTTRATQASLFSDEITEQKIAANPFVAGAGIAALAGIASAALIPVRIFSAAISAAGALCLLKFKFNLDAAVREQGEGVITATYHIGYWSVLLLFCAGILAPHLISRLTKDRDEQRETRNSRSWGAGTVWGIAGGISPRLLAVAAGVAAAIAGFQAPEFTRQYIDNLDAGMETLQLAAKRIDVEGADYIGARAATFHNCKTLSWRSGLGCAGAATDIGRQEFLGAHLAHLKSAQPHARPLILIVGALSSPTTRETAQSAIGAFQSAHPTTLDVTDAAYAGGAFALVWGGLSFIFGFLGAPLRRSA